MAIKKIKAGSLVQDFKFYPRAQVDEQHVREMAEAIRAGAQLPPIIIDGKSKRIIDGFHRIRAHQKVGGTAVVVSVNEQEFADDAAMFQAAMTLNSAHGKNLSIYDKTRCLVLAGEMGIERNIVAESLSITIKKADSLLLERLAASGEVLKRTMAHMAGEELTESQAATNQRAGGMNQLFYINQVVALLESDSIDWERPNVVEQLKKLSQLLDSKVKV